MKFVAFSFCALAAFAQSTPDRGKQVVGDALAALGGQKFQAVKDRVESGRAYSFYRDQLTGLAVAKILTRYVDKAPDGMLAQSERQVFGKDEDQIVLFLPDNAYQITYRGARPIQTQRFSRYAETTRRNIFYIFRHRMNEPGMVFESKGSTVWQNTPVDIVDIIDADNNTVTVHFHKSTKLPVRQEFIRRDPKTKERIEEVSIFSKYRDVGGGVQWPFVIRTERNGEKLFELYSESVMVNQGLSNDLFSLPGGLKVLPAERDTTP